MPTTIRLARSGAKRKPFYRIVVTNSRSPRDSKFIEKIGTYNPMLPKEDPKRVTIVTERAEHWIAVGATVSDRVHHFFHKAGLVKDAPRQRAHRKPRKEVAEAPAAPQAAPAAETAA